MERRRVDDTICRLCDEPLTADVTRCPNCGAARPRRPGESNAKTLTFFLIVGGVALIAALAGVVTQPKAGGAHVTVKWSIGTDKQLVGTVLNDGRRDLKALGAWAFFERTSSFNVRKGQTLERYEGAWVGRGSYILDLAKGESAQIKILVTLPVQFLGRPIFHCNGLDEIPSDQNPNPEVMGSWPSFAVPSPPR